MMSHLLGLLILFNLVVFVGCGVQTDSSGTPTSTPIVDDNNGTVPVVDNNDTTPVVDDNETEPVDDDPVVVPDDGDTEPQESVFDTTGAIYDANACSSSYADLMLKDNDDDSGLGVSDDENGIGIQSFYSGTGFIEDSEVTLYYKSISGEVGNPAFRKNGYFDNSQFRIEYDLVWINEVGNTIYVKTPKLENELQSCYKIVLDSNIGSSLSETKVFRY